MFLSHGANAFEIKNKVGETVHQILDEAKNITIDEENKKIIFNAINLTKPTKATKATN